MSMSSCWLITWFILCSGGFVYHFASGPCFFDVCARFNQLLLKHWWKLCQACEGRLLYLENNSRWGRVGFSELGCIHLFIYFWLFKGCFKGTKKRADFFMFLCSEPTFIWLSYISCQRETTRECSWWFCAASDGRGQLVSAGTIWSQVFVAGIQTLCELEQGFELIRALAEYCLVSSDSACALAKPSLCNKSCNVADVLSFGLGGCLAVGWLLFWLNSTLSLGRS